MMNWSYNTKLEMYWRTSYLIFGIPPISQILRPYNQEIVSLLALNFNIYFLPELCKLLNSVILNVVTHFVAKLFHHTFLKVTMENWHINKWWFDCSSWVISNKWSWIMSFSHVLQKWYSYNAQISNLSFCYIAKQWRTREFVQLGFFMFLQL